MEQLLGDWMEQLNEQPSCSKVTTAPFFSPARSYCSSHGTMERSAATTNGGTVDSSDADPKLQNQDTGGGPIMSLSHCDNRVCVCWFH